MAALNGTQVKVELQWTGRGLQLVAPPGMSSQPEQAVAAGAANTLLTMFRALAGYRHIQVSSCRIQAWAETRLAPGEPDEIARVILRPEIHVPAADIGQAWSALAEAFVFCSRSSPLWAVVEVEPSVQWDETAQAA